ncbi:MAG: CpXC domain-containing protein [Lachnospiraceae bacterium]|nr:CpXC domain-containing protein [Lachnospiraceae bacterium]
MIPCPGCGQALRFDIPSQKMKCQYCDGSYDPYEVEKLNRGSSETDTMSVTVFTCPQCGGEMYSTDTDITGFCSYCGSPNTLTSRISEEQRPTHIIPFAYTKEACKKAYAQKLKRESFAPNYLKSAEFIDGFRGVYMPYWSYSVNQETEMSLSGKTVTVSGNKEHTDYYDLTAGVKSDFDGVTFDASSTLYDDISAILAPYNIRERKPFTPGFLSGFYGDLPDVPYGIYRDNAETFVRDSVISEYKKDPAFKKYTIDGQIQSPESYGIKTNSKVDRLLLPVWFMSYKNKDRVAYAIVNGQTGKVYADLPISPFKYLRAVGIVAAIVFLLLSVFFTPKPNTALIFSSILGLISVGMVSSGRKKLNRLEAHANDEGYLYHKGKSSLSDAEIKELKQWKYPNPLRVILCIAGGLFAVWVLGATPVNDAWYYGACLVIAALTIWNFLYIFTCYNKRVTHRPPQFDKQGGDDNA